MSISHTCRCGTTLTAYGLDHLRSMKIAHAKGCRSPSRLYSNVRIEYMIDFRGIARNTLTEAEYQVFRFHVMLRAEWQACCDKTGQTRGQFFHIVYRIERKLGRAYAETLPFPLFPTREYFQTPVKSAYAAKFIERTRKKREKVIKPPLAMAAGAFAA